MKFLCTGMAGMGLVLRLLKLEIMFDLEIEGEPNTLYRLQSFSPDGQRLALYSVRDGRIKLRIYDTKTGDPTRLTTGRGDYTGLTWLPDGGVLLFGGAAGMAWVHSDRPGDATPLTNVRTAQTPWSVAPSGRRLAYYERNPDTGFDLWTAPLAANDDRLTLLADRIAGLVERIEVAALIKQLALG